MNTLDSADAVATADDGSVIASLEDVAVHFGGVRAIDGVSLALPEGRCSALVGPNGSGKTTLVNTLSRLVDPTAGRVRFAGEDVTGTRPHALYQRGLARTFQGIRLVPDLTVRENVLLGVDQLAAPRVESRAHARSLVDEALLRLEIHDLAHLPTSALPYGVQRRVEIARAVAGHPRLLLLDEPVAGMSTGERRDIAEVLSQLRSDGLSMLLIEHDLQFVLGLSDVMFVLNFGTLLAGGDPARTAALPAVQEAFLGRKHVTS